MNKLRVDCYVDAGIYYKLLAYQKATGAKTVSLALNAALTTYFSNREEADVGIERLNKVIQGFQNKIENLEHELRLKNVQKI
jgi:hypothetical protein